MDKREQLLDDQSTGRDSIKDQHKLNHKSTTNYDYVNFWKAFLCSLAFLGMYVALYSAQNIQSVLFEKDGYDSLGFYSNAVAYLGQGTGSVFCVWIMMRIGAAKSMSRFAIINLPFIICLLIPAYKSDHRNDPSWYLQDGFVYSMVLVTSVLNGFAQGVVQPASGNYIAECATEETKGFYFAFFWSFYMGSQVFGNLIAAFVLGNLSQVAYVLIMFVIAGAATFLLFFLREPIVHHHLANQETMEVVAKKSNQKQARPQEGQLKEGIMKLWHLQTDKRFLWILPQSAWTGVSIAYFSGNLVEMLQGSIGGDDVHEQFKYSMLAMVLFGVGEVLGCFFIGYFIDKFDSRFAVIVNLIIITVMSAVTITFIVIFEFNAWAWIMCFMWGFQDSAVNTHTQEILGFEFDDNYTPFSLFNIWQCIACFIFQLIVSAVNDQPAYLYFTIATTIIGLFCCGLPFWFPFREEKAQHTNFKSIVETMSPSNSFKKNRVLEDNHQESTLDNKGGKIQNDSERYTEIEGSLRQ